MLKQPRMTQEEKDRLFYIQALKSGQCRCERPKQRGRAFCYKCWLRLPLDLRMPLYRKIGDGFEQAYDNATKYLNG